MFYGLFPEDDALFTHRSADGANCRVCQCFEALSPFTLEFLERVLTLRRRQPYRDFREIVRECCFDPHNQVRPLEEFNMSPNVSVADIEHVLRLRGQNIS